MPSFYRILTYLFFILYACTILFIAVNADKVLSMGNDFQAQYGAARLQVLGKDVYNLEQEALVQTEATGRAMTTSDAVPFINSPLTLLLLTPLGLMPFAVAYAVWTAVLYLLLLVCWNLLLKLYSVLAGKKGGQLDVQARDLFLLVIIIVHPVIVALFAGQLSLLLLLAMVGSFWFLQKNQDVWGGVLLALLFVKPYLLVAPLLLLIYKRRWHAIAACVLVVGALYAVAWIWLGDGPFVRYSALAQSLFWIGDEPMKIHLSRQIGIRGLVFALSGNTVFTSVQMAVWTALVGLSGVLVYCCLSKKEKRHITPQDWALCSVFMVISAIHMHGHDGVLLIFPLLVWYVYSRLTQLKKTAILVVMTVFLLPVIFYAGPLVSAMLLVALGYRCYTLRYEQRTN